MALGIASAHPSVHRHWDARRLQMGRHCHITGFSICRRHGDTLLSWFLLVEYACWDRTALPDL
jgi:hypothetical protein